MRNYAPRVDGILRALDLLRPADSRGLGSAAVVEGKNRRNMGGEGQLRENEYLTYLGGAAESAAAVTVAVCHRRKWPVASVPVRRVRRSQRASSVHGNVGH